jgi:hypothetical protein
MLKNICVKCGKEIPLRGFEFVQTKRTTKEFCSRCYEEFVAMYSEFFKTRTRGLFWWKKKEQIYQQQNILPIVEKKIQKKILKL